MDQRPGATVGHVALVLVLKVVLQVLDVVLNHTVGDALQRRTRVTAHSCSTGAVLSTGV